MRGWRGNHWVVGVLIAAGCIGVDRAATSATTTTDILADFDVLAARCAPRIQPALLRALVRTESSGNPYAIGVVAGQLLRQPVNAAEAVATARWLQGAGYHFSMGLAQIHHRQAARYGHTLESIFAPCSNLQVGAAILEDCHVRAAAQLREPTAALRAALSCYYSGNFTRGLRPEGAGRLSYVDRILAHVDAGTSPHVTGAVVSAVASDLRPTLPPNLPPNSPPIGLVHDAPFAGAVRPVAATERRAAADRSGGQWIWMVEGGRDLADGLRGGFVRVLPGGSGLADGNRVQPSSQEDGR